MDFTEELSGPWSEDFVAGYIEASTRNGRTKTVPYEIGLTPIWYDSAHLAQVGYDEFPKTMDEFWKLAVALKAADVVPSSQMTGGGNAWTSMLWFSHIVGSLGGPDVWSGRVAAGLHERALQRIRRSGELKEALAAMDDPRPHSAAGRSCLWKAGSTVAERC